MRGYRTNSQGQGRQFAALALPQENDGRVLLVTSRETKRWVLPKGWAEKRLTGPEVAAKEAFEEAGAVGDIGTRAIGSYRYLKRLPSGEAMDCLVKVFLLRVRSLEDSWPERDQRIRRWFPLQQAAGEVEEEGLAAMLLQLAAHPL